MQIYITIRCFSDTRIARCHAKYAQTKLQERWSEWRYRYVLREDKSVIKVHLVWS